MKTIGEMYWRSTASERLALVIVAIGLSLKLALLLGLGGAMGGFVVLIVGFTCVLVPAFAMLLIGGGGHDAFWRRMLDRFLPILAWGLVFGLLIATRDLT